MKKILLFGLLIAILFGCKMNNKVLLTDSYAGIYKFGENVEEESVGSMTIYPETDSTVLFYIDICRGAPAYNMGQLYDRLKIENGKGIYFTNDFDEEKGCKWQIIINDKTLIITTISDCYFCGFGNGVIVDNIYNKKSDLKPEFFTDGHGDKIFFIETSPENYFK